jgi:hypothetical protein
VTPAGLPPLTSVADLHAIERVPLAGRDLALTTYELLLRAARHSVWIPDAAVIEEHVPVTFGGLREAGRLVVRLTGDAAADLLRGYDVEIRVEEEP